MKRGLLMSFALISVLASILFLAAELRNLSYEVSGQTDTAPDHSLFMKTVITGHRLWMIEMQDKIQEDSLVNTEISSCGARDESPVIFDQEWCTLQATEVEVNLVEPIMSMCEDAFVTEQTEVVDTINSGGSEQSMHMASRGHVSSYTVRTPVNCPSISVSMSQDLVGEITYKLDDTNTAILPYDFELDQINFDELNERLLSGHDSCKGLFDYYDCLSTQVDVCGHSLNTVCLMIGSVEMDFYVNEANLPKTVKVEENNILVRNPDETFTITEFTEEVRVSPSTVSVSSSYSDKIVNTYLYSLADLNCETTITYCNNILNISKTRDHVYLSFPSEDEYYTFGQ